jgi:Leucine-rich repeat (LRR) protein
MTGLKKLNVSHNLLTTVPRNSIPKLYELHTIDLSHNLIHELWTAVFQPLLSLRALNLSNNALTGTYALTSITLSM